MPFGKWWIWFSSAFNINKHKFGSPWLLLKRYGSSYNLKDGHSVAISNIQAFFCPAICVKIKPQHTVQLFANKLSRTKNNSLIVQLILFHRSTNKLFRLWNITTVVYIDVMISLLHVIGLPVLVCFSMAECQKNVKFFLGCLNLKPSSQLFQQSVAISRLNSLIRP